MGVLSSFSLEGKVAIVTGGKRGIGKAIVLAFAEAGADVAICSRTLTDGRLEGTANEIRRLGRRSLAVQADVSRKADVDNLVQRVMDEFGVIDILVNNAGIYVEVPTIKLSEEDWDMVQSIDLKGAFLCSQAAGRIMMKQKRGNIINIASVVGLRPQVNPGGYDVAKAGVIMLSNSMAVELAHYNIRVNTIAPGYIRTEINDYIFKDDPEHLKAIESATAMGRIGEPIEIAMVALFLASDASSFVTGCTINADGGFLWQSPLRAYQKV